MAHQVAFVCQLQNTSSRNGQGLKHAWPQTQNVSFFKSCNGAITISPMQKLFKGITLYYIIHYFKPRPKLFHIKHVIGFFVNRAKRLSFVTNVWELQSLFHAYKSLKIIRSKGRHQDFPGWHILLIFEQTKPASFQVPTGKGDVCPTPPSSLLVLDLFLP